jgi:hypothetical protein
MRIISMGTKASQDCHQRVSKEGFYVGGDVAQ